MMQKNVADWLKPFNRRFVDDDFRISDAASIKPWIDSLLSREINNVQDLRKWLEDYSEVQSIVSEDANRRYVAMTCDTKDENKRDSYLYHVREIQPKISEWTHQLNSKFYESPFRKELEEAEFGRLDKIISTSIELYTEKNIPIEVKLAEMSQEYQTITGGWTVEFDGKAQTMPQMSRYLQDTDRSLRERAWTAIGERRLKDADKLETLFDSMLESRREYANNLGFENYLGYAFKSKLRDYTPDDCLKFHESIERAVVPLARKIAEKRRNLMKLETLRPWDMQVDPLGRAPLRPYKEISELQSGVEKMFDLIDPRLGERFASIREHMDLESRDGKAPGGYQTTFEEMRLPFIFTNGAGLHMDVITLLHEGGHAFHTLSSRDFSYIWYRHAATEFSEVASMTQELLALPFMNIFYGDGGDADRARLEQLERVVDIFPWVATVDAFQHWLYTNPGHTRKERGEAWIDILARFEAPVDWTGLDMDMKRYTWHRQLHIFEVPFYYIEYAIAQLGALELYRIYRTDPSKAINSYLKALSLGGSKPPSELFEATGIKFDFSLGMLSSLMDMLEEEIESI